MAKTITSVQVTYEDGTSAILTQGELRSPFAPGGKIVLDAPKAPEPREIGANPGAYDGDAASDPTLTHAPQFWEGQFLPPYPPSQRMCDMARADIELAREVWKRMFGVALDESRMSPAQRKRCGL